MVPSPATAPDYLASDYLLHLYLVPPIYLQPDWRVWRVLVCCAVRGVITNGGSNFFLMCRERVLCPIVSTASNGVINFNRQTHPRTIRALLLLYL